MSGSAVINIINLPDVHNVTGGGSFCRGGAGVDIALDGSQSGYYYELFDGTVSQGLLYGTGGPLDFGLQTATGNYTVIGNNQITTCLNNMFGSATVAYDSIPKPVVVLSAFPGNGIGVWHVDSIMVNVSNTGDFATYQWYVNGNIIPGATNASFTNHVFYNRDSIACIVTSHTTCGTNTTRQSIVLTLNVEGVSSLSSAQGELSIVPNPNKGIFTLKGHSGQVADGRGSIQIVDVLGRVVFNKETTVVGGNIEDRIDPDKKLSSGIYVLSFQLGTQIVIQRFVVE